jgi:hypothetical protein
MKKREKEEIISFPIPTKEIDMNVNIKDRTAIVGNRLIEARINLNTNEQKLFVMIISLLDKVEEKPNDFPILKIPIRKILEIIYSDNNHKEVKKALDKMVNKVIKLKGITEKGKEITKWYPIFSKAEYIEGSSYITVQFHKELMPLLLALKNEFTKLPVRYCVELKSKYSIRLYELFKKYENTGHRVDSYEELRDKLGIEEERYKEYKKFEEKILKPSVKEINEKTDISIEYKKIRTKRKISHIEFFIAKKHNEPEEFVTGKPKATPDLWQTVVKIMEIKYNIPEEITELLGKYVVAKYKNKKMILKINSVIKKAFKREYKVIQESLIKNLPLIEKIVKIETNGNYEVTIEE